MKKFMIILLVLFIILGSATVYFGLKLMTGIKEKASNMTAEKLAGAALHEKVKIRQDGKEITVRDITITQGLPEYFPKDFPMYPKSEVTGSAGKTTSFTTTVRMDASVLKVFAFYSQNLPNKGWAVEENSLGSLQMLKIKKGDQEGSMIFTEDDGKTNMMINLKKKD